MTLQDKTLFISGGSRGIGLAIALRAARDGANVALIAKTAEPHPKLEGTIYTAAEEIEAAGGKRAADRRRHPRRAAGRGGRRATVERFGGIDVCVNNASAINLAGTEALEMKRYDLMQDINTRGTFVVSRACIPHLREGGEPAHPDALAAAQPRPAVARPARRLHDRQVRHDACARSGSRRSCARTGSRPTRCGRAR